MLKAGIVGLGAELRLPWRLRCGGPFRSWFWSTALAPAKGVAIDMRYGVPVSPPIGVEDGDYGDLAGAGVVIIATGQAGDNAGFDAWVCSRELRSKCRLGRGI